LPGKTNPNLLDVVICNVGKSPAYNISFIFDPTLPYTDTATLSDMAIFKTPIFLANNHEIRFFYRDLFSILAEGAGFGPKQTNVSVTYEDSKKHVYSEKYTINIERFKGLLTIEQRGTNDLFKELGNIRKELERIQNRGLLIKTPADLEKERREEKKFYNQLRGTCAFAFIANAGIEMTIKPAIAAIAIAILKLGIFCFSVVVDVFIFLSIKC
jgi:hypothetical protein